MGRETLAGLAANDHNGAGFEAAGRLEGEVGYGFAVFGGGFTGTSSIGFARSEGARDYRLGWRLTSALRGDPGFQVDFDATRTERAADDAGHGVMLRSAIRWEGPLLSVITEWECTRAQKLALVRVQKSGCRNALEEMRRRGLTFFAGVIRFTVAL